MSTGIATREKPRCRACLRRHRSWYARARCLLAPTYWVTGNPPVAGRCFASVSDCGHVDFRPMRTVVLYPDRDQAEAAKRSIDGHGCGGRCSRRHRVVELRP